MTSLEKDLNENLTMEYLVKDDTITQFQDELICSICSHILINPFMCTQCQKCVCKKCLDKCLDEEDSKKDSNSRKCSFNCEDATFIFDRKTNSILENLIFNCKNGCGQKLKPNELKEHLKVCLTQGKETKSSDSVMPRRVERKALQKIKNVPTKKIILLGASGVGKTCVLQRFNTQIFRGTVPSTIGFNFIPISYQLSDGTYMNFQIWDTAGQEKYKTLTVQYFRDVDGCILMYDITKKETFSGDVIFYYNKLKESLEKIPTIILVGNKNDLENERQIPVDDAINMAKDNNFLFTEASAKTDHNISKLFEDLFEMVNFEHKKDMISNSNQCLEHRRNSNYFSNRRGTLTLSDVYKEEKHQKKCCA